MHHAVQESDQDHGPVSMSHSCLCGNAGYGSRTGTGQNSSGTGGMTAGMLAVLFLTARLTSACKAIHASHFVSCFEGFHFLLCCGDRTLAVHEVHLHCRIAPMHAFTQVQVASCIKVVAFTTDPELEFTSLSLEGACSVGCAM